MPCWPVPASTQLSAPIHATRPRKIQRPSNQDVLTVNQHEAACCHGAASAEAQPDGAPQRSRSGPQHSSGIIDLCTQLSLLCTSYILQYILQVTCGNCNGAGHYHLTCEAECRWCGFKPYKAHLSSASEE